LEPVTLLSGVATALHGAAVPAAATTPPTTGHEIDLNGTARGSYTVHRSNPDTGKDYTFFGSGRITPIGRADLTGHIHTLGNVASGNAEGQLFLATPRGTLTLSLEGPKQDGFAPIPDHFTFRITNASGAFRHDHGRGTVVLVLDPAKPGPGATPGNPADHGTFTMVFLSMPDHPTPTA
jgi:hypothetical protein